jgi:SAM-dependent methyltransferase
MPESDKVFAGSIPALYDTYLVPLIFEPYAADLAKRLSSRPLSRVLEVAAGTGVVTRAMVSALPETVSIVATDLNQAMLDRAAAVGTKRPVEWRQADAMQLPFPDGAFDAVLCQFGVMFFPEKSKAFAEARRVLRPGGVYLFNVWDRIEENEFADTVTSALQTLFPSDPPRFMVRTPHGYHDHRRPARSRGRRLCRSGPDGYARGAQPGRIPQHPGDRLLPGHATEKRDRGARRYAAGRSHRLRGGGGRQALRARRRGRQDPGAHRRYRSLKAAAHTRRGS